MALNATGSQLTKFAERLPHLSRRFFGVFGARLQAADLMVLERYLSPRERALFDAMTLGDRRHSLDLATKLLGNGHDHPDLLRGALLHDVGKSAGPLPLPHRVAYALAAYLWPALARWLAGGQCSGWRRPFFIAAHHARLGADLAAQAGCQSTVVALIRGHETPGLDRLSRLLYQYDRSM